MKTEMEDKDFEAHDELLSSLTMTQQVRLDQLMQSANWLCDNGVITWRQCTAAEAAMLNQLLTEQA